MAIWVDPKASEDFDREVHGTEPGSGIVRLAWSALATGQEFHVHLTLAALDGVDEGVFHLGPPFVLGPAQIRDTTLEVLETGEPPELR
jgi:hypothetical protein